MKVTIITVVFNGERYIDDCIRSVATQTYPFIEHILIDGGSTDNTLLLLQKWETKIAKLVSEPDNGMYDALNKGIAMATGEIIGVLNADDMLAAPTVIGEIVQYFNKTNADAVYGDLNYVQPETLKPVRRWVSSAFDRKAFESGWMPAHPTLYLKRDVFKKVGGYSQDFGSAGDYEFMLRTLYNFAISAAYLPVLIVNMRSGGQSNANFAARLSAFVADYQAARKHKLPFPLLAVTRKKIKKIGQFFAR